MNKNPLVSVIIPTYNYACFLSEAVESVLKQSYKNWECIIVDDGSTDDTKNVVDLFTAKDKRIKYVCHKKNRGLASARNTGIKESSGKYIQFLDADDWLDQNKIRFQLRWSLEKSAPISYCEVAQYEQNRQRPNIRYVGQLNDQFKHLYCFWFVYPFPIHSLLIKRNIFDTHGKFLESLRACEDRYFLCKLIYEGQHFSYFPFVGGFRRLHNQNMNTRRPFIFQNIIHFYKQTTKDFNKYFFSKNYGFSSVEIMNANLTYLYFKEISDSEIKIKDVAKIRNILAKDDIHFCLHPIPNEFGFNRNVSTLYGISFIKRLLRMVRGKSNCNL